MRRTGEGDRLRRTGELATPRIAGQRSAAADPSAQEGSVRGSAMPPAAASPGKEPQPAASVGAVPESSIAESRAWASLGGEDSAWDGQARTAGEGAARRDTGREAAQPEEAGRDSGARTTARKDDQPGDARADVVAATRVPDRSASQVPPWEATQSGTAWEDAETTRDGGARPTVRDDTEPTATAPDPSAPQVPPWEDTSRGAAWGEAIRPAPAAGPAPDAPQSETGPQRPPWDDPLWERGSTSSERSARRTAA